MSTIRPIVQLVDIWMFTEYHEVMRGDLIYKVLDFIEDSARGTADFVDTFLSAGYGASLGKFQYLGNIKAEKRLDYQIDREKRRQLQKYIHKLKKDGLISLDQEGQFQLSAKGKKKLMLLKSNKPIDKDTYQKEVSDKVTIISYDIPEVFRRERKILRDLLLILGFNSVHKSVWVGKVKLPKQFIADLQRLGILDCVEILEVTKTGSLKAVD